MEKHKYGFYDGNNIITAGFVVNFYGDSSVGIQDGSWAIKPDRSGPFYFDDEEQVEEFKEALSTAFEIVTGDRCGVETLEEQCRRLDAEEAALNPQLFSNSAPPDSFDQILR